MKLRDKVLNKWDEEIYPKQQEVVIQPEDVGETVAVATPVEEVSTEFVDPEAMPEAFIAKPEAASTETPEENTFISKEDAASANPFSGGFYQTQMERMNADIKPETPEEKYKREKMERTRSTLFSLTDGIAHLFNIWGTAGGAQAMDISNMTEAHRKRMDIAKEARDRNSDAYNRQLFQALAMDRKEDIEKQVRLQAKEEKDKQWAYQIEQDKKKEELDREALAQRKKEFELTLQLKEANLELDKKKTESQINVDKARIGQLGAQSRSYKLKTPEGKNVDYTAEEFYIQFDVPYGNTTVKEGVVLNVPKSLKKDFVANVFNKMIEVATINDDKRRSQIEAGEKSSVQMIREEFDSYSEGSLEPSSSKMETAMLSHAASLGLQEYMVSESNRINAAYLKHLSQPDRTEAIAPQNIIVPMEDEPELPDPSVLKGRKKKEAEKKKAEMEQLIEEEEKRKEEEAAKKLAQEAFDRGIKVID